MQGVVGLTWFDGTHKRNILDSIDDFGGDTARGSKSARSFTGGVKLVLPMGLLALEPAQIVASKR